MKFRPKIWQLIFVIWLIVFILRVELFTDTAILIYYFFNVFVSEGSSRALSFADFPFIDMLFSFFLMLLIPPLLFFLRKRKHPSVSPLSQIRERISRRFRFPDQDINFTNSAIVLLLMSVLLAPLITNENPDFHKSLGMTRLLPPLSSLKAIYTNTGIENRNSPVQLLADQKKKIIKTSFNEYIIYTDSIKISETESELVYYQKKNTFTVPVKNLLLSGRKPYTRIKIFLLGTDEFGRDIFARLVYGARVSIFIGLGAVIISLLIGLSAGYFAGYYGGITDTILNRAADMFLAFPALFLVILVIALFGNSLFSIIIVLGFSGWMSLFKVVRGEILSVKQKDYFISARLLGLSGRKLLFREILPVVMIPVIVNIVFLFSSVILAESALSYLGLGAGLYYPSWGSMIQSGQEYLSHAWWMIFFPGIMLVCTILAANNSARYLAEKYNPRLIR
jgi:peptide/nickel transport system permease protein